MGCPLPSHRMTQSEACSPAACREDQPAAVVLPGVVLVSRTAWGQDGDPLCSCWVGACCTDCSQAQLRSEVNTRRKVRSWLRSPAGTWWVWVWLLLSPPCLTLCSRLYQGSGSHLRDRNIYPSACPLFLYQNVWGERGIPSMKYMRKITSAE